MDEFFLSVAYHIYALMMALPDAHDLVGFAVATELGPFTSRELATATIVLAIVIWSTLAVPNIRDLTLDLIRAAKPIIPWFISIVAYFALIVSVLYYVGLWHFGLAVPTFLWILTVGLLGAIKSVGDQGRLPTLTVSVVISLIAAWLVGLHTFPFIVELAYLSVGGVVAVAISTNDRGKANASSIGIVTSLILFSIVTIPSILSLLNASFDRRYIESLALPLVGMSTLVPLIYLLNLIVLYQGIRRRLQIYSANDEICRYAWYRTLRRFHFRLPALRRFRSLAARDLFWAQSRADVDAAFRKHAAPRLVSVGAIGGQDQSVRLVAVAVSAEGVGQLSDEIAVGSILRTDGPAIAGIPGFASLTVGDPPNLERIVCYREILGPTEYRVKDVVDGAFVREFNTQRCLPWKVASEIEQTDSYGRCGL